MYLTHLVSKPVLKHICNINKMWGGYVPIVDEQGNWESLSDSITANPVSPAHGHAQPLIIQEEFFVQSRGAQTQQLCRGTRAQHTKDHGVTAAGACRRDSSARYDPFLKVSAVCRCDASACKYSMMRL